MTKAVKKLIDISFKDYYLEKITIHCQKENINKVAKRAGLCQEALLKKHMVINRESKDFYRYAILR